MLHVYIVSRRQTRPEIRMSVSELSDPRRSADQVCISSLFTRDWHKRDHSMTLDHYKFEAYYEMPCVKVCDASSPRDYSRPSTPRRMTTSSPCP